MHTRPSAYAVRCDTLHITLNSNQSDMAANFCSSALLPSECCSLLAYFKNVACKIRRLLLYLVLRGITPIYPYCDALPCIELEPARGNPSNCRHSGSPCNDDLLASNHTISSPSTILPIRQPLYLHTLLKRHGSCCTGIQIVQDSVQGAPASSSGRCYLAHSGVLVRGFFWSWC